MERLPAFTRAANLWMRTAYMVDEVILDYSRKRFEIWCAESLWIEKTIVWRSTENLSWHTELIRTACLSKKRRVHNRIC